MTLNKLALRIESEAALKFLREVLLAKMTPPADKQGVQIFETGLETLTYAERAFDRALSLHDRQALLAATDQLVWAVMCLGNFFPKFSFEQQEELRDRTARARAARITGRMPEIKSRKKLLLENYDVEVIGKSRKNAESIVGSFAPLCKSNGIKPVGGKQIHQDAKALLSAGPSDRAPKK
jgi:hypothetical protein